MPLFEYRCSKCSAKFEVLHKSINNLESVYCPECHSTEINKLISSFSAAGFSKSVQTWRDADSCEAGSCGCSSGYCSLN